MMTPVWWIREIDWRISSGIIFFIHLVMWNKAEKKRSFGARIFLSFVLLCAASWCMRYTLEVVLSQKVLVAIGYSFYIMVLSLLFVLCARFCYHISNDAAIFNSIIALTIYRISWDAVKLISAIPVSPDATWTGGSPFQSIMSYMLYVLIEVCCLKVYQYFVHREVSFPLKAIRCIFVVILLSQMLLEFMYQLLFPKKLTDSGMLFFLTALLYSVVNFILLMLMAYLSLLQHENLSMQNFISSKQRYYEISREGILSLQIKCHDLKHYVNLLRSTEGQRQFQKYLDSLRDSIDEFNTVVDSGNKSLDVVLTEKNIICSMNGVRFTYIVDGKLFYCLTDMEIYALFGNAMDNALEGMEHVEHPEKKFISLRAARRDDMVILVVENYFEHELKFENGLPITTKEEEHHHGFGLRSIIAIAQQHGGNASVEAEGNTFRLTVSMRIEPEE
ncbi:ATP-binding protein [Marvinbryantia sp.]|uniref:ATP-binding protein n=1 Tax=Marvinbryantia sp. TaxID=2496532 RepID=UPI0025F59B6A|nr:GHKL domain-containing protein [uncultured Marvinbryantia sp.]